IALILYLTAPLLHGALIEHRADAEFAQQVHVDRCEHRLSEDVPDNSSTVQENCPCVHTHHVCLASLLLRGMSWSPSLPAWPPAPVETLLHLQPLSRIQPIGHQLAPKTSPPAIAAT
ncbi:MAG: hypothetical protein AAF449_21860, partial [Myxococcota bacterium]